MYIYSSLPIAFTLPLAFYLHSKQPSELQESNVGDIIRADKGADNEIGDVFSGKESFAISAFLKSIFDGEGRFTLMELDGLSQTMYNIAQDEINLFAILWNCVPHLFLTVFFTIIIKYTILGIFGRIALRRARRGYHWFRQSLFGKFFSSEIVLQRVESNSTEGDDFFECSSLIHEVVAREESIPKANQAEEKLVGCKQTSSKESTETVLVETSLHDSGIVNVHSIGTMVSSMDISLKDVCVTTSNMDTDVFNSTAIPSGEASPEKFKRFLHERNEDIERLGISFDSDDGYLPESDFEAESEIAYRTLEKSNEGGVSKSAWEKVTSLL